MYIYLFTVLCIKGSNERVEHGQKPDKSVALGLDGY